MRLRPPNTSARLLPTPAQIHDAPRRSRLRAAARLMALALTLMLVAAACSSDDSTETTTEEPAEATAVAEPATESEAASEPTVEVRESGNTVTVQPAGELTVHSFTASEQVFANSTHIIETPNSLVLVDTQFLLPNAQDFRAYAEELGKPIDRMFITHEHPDHFLGSEAFNDIDIYALASVSDAIAAAGDAEVAEKQADFGDAIAGSFVTPQFVDPGTIQIDGYDFILEEIIDAEAETQLVIKVPAAGALVAGDIVYSGVHLILAGQPPTWTEALTELQTTSNDYPLVLPGHGIPATPDVYQDNIDWLATASELMGTATTADEFKTGLTNAYPTLGMAAAIDFVTPFLFPTPETEEAAGADVAFGECTEVSTGTVTPLAALQAELPEGVTALSLTAQGTVFEGSDDLGVLIARTLRCDEISVNVNGETTVGGEQHIAHVGTPISTDGFPGTTYNNDGGNGADFNNYIFGYYSDSAAYVEALSAAGVTGAEVAAITMTDVAVSDCVVNRTMTVSAGDFAFDATGDIPDAACEEPVVPFIANWWSVAGTSVAAASNNIPGQAAIFIDTAATTVTVTPTGEGFQRLVGTADVTADAFGVIGLLPASDGPSMTISTVGELNS